MATKEYKVLKGLRYPKSKTIRSQMRAGKKTSADVGQWVRVEEGKRRVTIPTDMVPAFLKRSAIEEEV